jgi:formate dehydrogenase subunit delta
MQEIDSLVKMANQIARNFAFHEDAVDRIADHLKRFWAPSMREKLSNHVAEGGKDVLPEVAAALGSAATSE